MNRTHPNRSKSDARLQSAALRHYACKCRVRAQNPAGYALLTPDQLLELAERAEKLADSYDKLS